MISTDALRFQPAAQPTELIAAPTRGAESRQERAGPQSPNSAATPIRSDAIPVLPSRRREVIPSVELRLLAARSAQKAIQSSALSAARSSSGVAESPARAQRSRCGWHSSAAPSPQISKPADSPRFGQPLEELVERDWIAAYTHAGSVVDRVGD